MDQKEYNKTLPSIPSEERSAFQIWYIEYQDLVSWYILKNTMA